MCGIFGTVIKGGGSITYYDFNKLSNNLFKYSSSRGKEAAELSLRPLNSIDILKDSGFLQNFI